MTLHVVSPGNLSTIRLSRQRVNYRSIVPTDAAAALIFLASGIFSVDKYFVPAIIVGIC